jgi:acyl-CoA reductase-like NAD-dependent aldehyde dehydrogenase
MANAQLTVDDPFTLDTACTVDLASAADVDRILDAATTAAKDARHTSVKERRALCERALEKMEQGADAIAADISRMMGKPLSQAKGEVSGMAGRFRHMLEIAESSLADIVLPKEGFERRIVKEPWGVVLDLPAWNYPLLTAVNAVVPAILAGNSVVLKHSPRSPLCGEHFARAFDAAGAPKGLLTALHASHETSEAMAGDPRVKKTLFTGSVYGGQRIQRAATEKHFTHVELELGGSDPVYVAPDCDVEKAAASLVDGAMYNAGQSCCAVERVYVHESIYAAFVAACEPLIRAYVMGDPRDEKTSLGPIAQPNHVAELAAFVSDATSKGARLVAGGRAAQVSGKGRFFEATLLCDVTHEMSLMKNESFGPIMPIMKVASDDEALMRMNDSRYGLTAAVYTKDRTRAERMAKELEAGTIYMNRCDSLDPALPWVGVKDSGCGVTLSALGFDHLTRPKAIHFRLTL